MIGLRSFNIILCNDNHWNHIIATSSMLANESSYLNVLLHVYMCCCSIAVHSDHVYYTILLATIIFVP